MRLNSQRGITQVWLTKKACARPVASVYSPPAMQWFAAGHDNVEIEALPPTSRAASPGASSALPQAPFAFADDECLVIADAIHVDADCPAVAHSGA
jgi:hypothetical protein